MAENQYGHIPSQKSLDLGRNVYVFSNSKAKGTPGRVILESEQLLIGLNQNAMGATGATLLRWLQLFDREMNSLDLRPVKMEKNECIPFAVWVADGSEGDPVDLNELIPPGDYTLTGRMCDVDSLLPFAKLKKHADCDAVRRRSLGDALDLYDFPDLLKTKVVERDGYVCFMTGGKAKELVDLSWIFPPTWGYLVEGNRCPWNFDRDRYLVEDNVVSMDRDLIEEFHDNAFGVDVDVRFHRLRASLVYRLTSVRPGLLSLAARAGGCDSRFDFFLRLHFRWCLQANLFGGDSYLDNRDKMDDAFERLGVDCYGDEHNIQKEDPEWLTDMGKAILGILVMRRDVTREEASTYGQPQI